ncbi:hypothetical protein CQ065_07015 [Pseudomonas sp. MYb187]|uniref:hypothetical protein n=1 Tax=Pseudomonas TaxID=286 RepID=UPI000CFCE3CE|nr:hypothetical protein [Pseudomonas sp. MYb187]PRA69326.1 hypothetical protein CQ065_07015 [Pseudomonas sp. MYb187]
MLNDYGKSLFKPWCSVPNAVWCLALLYLAWLTIRIYDLKSSDIASWVQAFGSIAAILGAFAISNRQATLQRESVAADELRRKNRFKSIMLLLAYKHLDDIRRLKKAVQEANYGSEPSKAFGPYIKGGYSLKWPSHLEALKSIDINELDANHLSALMDMQVAAQFSLALCGRLKDWESYGDEEEEAMERLERFSDEVQDNIRYIENEPWHHD